MTGLLIEIPENLCSISCRQKNGFFYADSTPIQSLTIPLGVLFFSGRSREGVMKPIPLVFYFSN